MALTDAWLKAVHRKPRDTTTEKADRDGLGARVTLTGKVVFQLRFRHQGKAARMDLGTYPAMTLKQARDEATRRRGQLEQGHDPRTMKRVEQIAIADAPTNEKLIREWHERYCKERKAGEREILRSFELHVFPTLGRLPADETGLRQWMDLLEPLAEQKPRIAERVLSNMKQAHKWGARRGIVEHQPLAAISAKEDLHVNRKRVKGRALSDAELWLIWQAMERSRMPLRSRLFVKLVLLYGCRPGELVGARREEFDLKEGVWEIPPERHKTGRVTGRALRRPVIEEVAPLLRQAMTLSRHPDLMFSGESKAIPLNDRSVLSYPYNIMRVVKNQLGKEMAHWSMYDLRKTARTNWATLAEPHICELMLGHVLPGVWQVYDRHDYLEEQAAAYRAWHDRLMRLVVDPPTP
ncbi:site-specific integrase [uncultured Halomonas sp.]|uniref:tyrosine-type recombinase/integrase n=1 Tax=uncultured Halomonas sp. TaxID=173971 RepID=UPI00263040C6|nr:site-specific integrase [uncultured Halomonas sp.]